MAAHAPPHLLTIPREIRDIIYGYLTHDVVHELVWQEHPQSPGRSFTMRFEHAPILSVLLTQSRINEEYRESRCFWNPRASMNYNISFYAAWDGGGKSPALLDQRLVKKALSHVHEFTVIMAGLPTDSASLWNNAQFLLDILIQHMLQLATVRLAYYSTPDELPLATLSELKTITMAHVVDYYRKAEFDEVVPPPLESLCNLPLEQHAEGLIFERVGGKWMDEFLTTVVRAWVFTNSNIDSVAMDSEELLQRKLRKDPSDSHVEVMSKEEAAQAMRMLSKIHDWKDLRGKEARQGAVDEEYYQLL